MTQPLIIQPGKRAGELLIRKAGTPISDSFILPPTTEICFFGMMAFKDGVALTQNFGSIEDGEVNRKVLIRFDDAEQASQARDQLIMAMLGDIPGREAGTVKENKTSKATPLIIGSVAVGCLLLVGILFAKWTADRPPQATTEPAQAVAPITSPSPEPSAYTPSMRAITSGSTEQQASVPPAPMPFTPSEPARSAMPQTTPAPVSDKEIVSPGDAFLQKAGRQ